MSGDVAKPGALSSVPRGQQRLSLSSKGIHFGADNAEESPGAIVISNVCMRLSVSAVRVSSRINRG